MTRSGQRRPLTRLCWPHSRSVQRIGAPGWNRLSRGQNKRGILGDIAIDCLSHPRGGVSGVDQFIRRHNVENYCRLLESVSDETERQTILKLLAEERQKQKDAGDKID